MTTDTIEAPQDKVALTNAERTFSYFMFLADKDIQERLYKLSNEVRGSFLANFAMCTQMAAERAELNTKVREYCATLSVFHRYTHAQVREQLTFIFRQALESEGEAVASYRLHDYLYFYRDTMGAFFDKLYIP